jgi:flagellar protein FliS
MSYQRPWNSYRQISAHTASPGQLVLMLYDGALRFLEKSLIGFEMDDPIEFNQTINNNLLRAQSIISELNCTLNLEHGGELARTLQRLYGYMDDRLMESNLAKKPEGIRDTIRRLTILRDAWQEMLQRRSVESALPSEASRYEVSSLCACG